MNPYFHKHFELENLSDCEYVRCENCGLVVAKTIYDLDADSWRKLNCKFHGNYQGTDHDPNDPNWISRLKTQAQMFVELFQTNVLDPSGRSVDYGCGDGKLADMINSRLDRIVLNKFDAYMTSISGGGGEFRPLTSETNRSI